MRFEIRAGGFLLILLGLLGLSGAVFFLGVMAGNEIAKQNTPDQAQISSTFPLPSPPPLEATPTPASIAINPTPIPMGAFSPAVASHPSVFTPMAGAAKSPVAMISPHAMSTRAAVANISTPASMESPGAMASPAAHKHPYNIQIQAVMDKNGADEMVRKLQALGYPATEQTTDIEGQTWYRVKVGPYDSQEEAQDAQARLREQYKAAYTGH
ncbi:MAG TPA: SPOR domain-containing protein [Candidatus Binataceae bacterium]|nr:SPOR domain-containing protein [Candidatus Binataceae bacterium]